MKKILTLKTSKFNSSKHQTDTDFGPLKIHETNSQKEEWDIVDQIFQKRYYF